MKYENTEMTVIIENGIGTVKMKKFGDVYGFRIEDGKLIAYSALGLSRAIKARQAFGF